MHKIRIALHILFGGVIGFLYFGKFGLVVPFNARITGKKKIQIGESFGAGSGLWLEAINSYKNVCHTPKIEIGKNVSFGYWCHVGAIGSIKIKDDVLFGSRVLVTDHSHGKYGGHDVSNPFQSSPIDRPLSYTGPIIIEKNVWIGDGVVILGGVTIGEGVVIAANSVVTKSIPEGVIAGGVPAKIIKSYSKELNQWVCV